LTPANLWPVSCHGSLALLRRECWNYATHCARSVLMLLDRQLEHRGPTIAMATIRRLNRQTNVIMAAPQRKEHLAMAVRISERTIVKITQ